MELIDFSWGAALLGGLVGTLAMTIFWYAARAAGAMRLDWGQILGSFFLRPGKRAMALGLVWHFINGLIFGVVYAYVILALGITPGVWPGLALGAVHAAVALAMIWFVPRIHPVLPDQPAPTIWSRWDLTLYTLGFPIFGLFFGGTHAWYDNWVSAYGMEPARFWLTAYGALAVALVIGLATFVLISRQREDESPVFVSGHLTVDEQKVALRRLYEQGDLTEDEYQAELAEIDREDWRRV